MRILLQFYSCRIAEIRFAEGEEMTPWGQLQPVDERPDNWPVSDEFTYKGYKI